MSAGRPGESAVRVVDVYPDLLGTYGDGGNALVLAQRLRWRGMGAELVRAPSGEPVPERADIYCLGGGEDGPQGRAAAELAADGGLSRAVAAGAVVLAVCAGFQVIGESFPGADGEPRAGVGLLDVRSRRGSGRRAVGEVVVRPGPATVPGGGLLTGYENHAGVTELGAGLEPLGTVVAGTGNGPAHGGGGAGSSGPRVDGAVSGRIVATYLHGPVLARNPALADHLLSLVAGGLPALDDGEAEQLRAERLRAVAGARGPGVGGWGEAGRGFLRLVSRRGASTG